MVAGAAVVLSRFLGPKEDAKEEKGMIRKNKTIKK
jgi:hypothetical protein